MKVENNILIDDLLRRTETSTKKVKYFQELTFDQLSYKGQGWNILECIEHLNLYGNFYLVAIEKEIMQAKLARSTTFHSGLLGNYFANLMEVKQGKIFKMKTPKDKNPMNRNLTIETLSRFLKQQEQLILLLNKSRSIDLTRNTVPISISRFVKLRLGDTLRFVVYHIERHVLQAERVCQEQLGIEEPPQ